MRTFGTPTAATEGYDLQAIEVPRMKGAPLKALATLVEKPGVGAAIRNQMLQNLGFGPFRDHQSTHVPTPFPSLPMAIQAPPSEGMAPLEPVAATLDGARRKDGFAFSSTLDYADAYRQKTTTPEDVARRFVAVHKASEDEKPALRAFISMDAVDVKAQAAAATARIEQGAPKSLLDGVPVAVKDELDQRNYPTTAGTAFLHRRPAEDAHVVARLRELGAVLVGKTNMHELGIGVTGLNPHHGSARNPYDTACFTGGSSSGSASAVAAGLVPAAIGADGGGSIRIPASLCGIVGLKPTWSRVSEHGAVDLCWSVAHIGPMAATAIDAALLFAAIAGEDAKDAHTRFRPAVDLSALLDRPTADATGDLSGIRIGVYDAWFDDAEDVVVERCRAALAAFVDRGAKLVPVSIADLELFRLAHLVTIVTEMATSQAGDYAEHAKDYALDTRLNLALARGLTAMDYVQAQRLRAHASEIFDAVLADVDVIATPTCGCVSEPYPEDALEDGESNLRLASKLMRFAGPANLTGLPAISIPVGYDDGGLPIGLQAMGRAFDEGLLLKLALAGDTLFAKRRPKFFRSPLA